VPHQGDAREELVTPVYNGTGQRSRQTQENLMAKQGKTTGNLKVRSGPGMEFEPPIAYLEPGTALEILGEEGDWLKVRVQGKEGYVGRKYVEFAPEAPTPAAEKPAGGIGKREAPPAAAKPAGSVPKREVPKRGDSTNEPS
jgi:hypothetical protein